MELSRRKLLQIGVAALGAAGLTGTQSFAMTLDEAIAEVTGGADTGSGDLVITAPEIAENGNTVPIDVQAPGATAIAVFADGNPTPKVATFKFGPLNPSHMASTRIRLASTQNVVAVAQMADGSFQMASVEVKVTIGGCGG
jgi:sulfur-oxidizing protein SoxY